MVAKVNKNIYLLLALFIMLALILVSCRREEVQIETYTARKGDIIHMISSTGYVDSKEVRNYSLQAGGMVISAKQKGDSFSRRDILFEVDNQMTVLSIQQARENLAIAESSLCQAEISYQQALENEHIAQQLAKENRHLAAQNTESALIALHDAQRLADKSIAHAREALEVARVTVDSAQVAYEEARKESGSITVPQLGDTPLYDGIQLASYEPNPNLTQLYLDNLKAELKAVQKQADMAQASYEQTRVQAEAQVHSAQSAHKQAEASQSITHWTTLGETQNAQKQIALAREAIDQAAGQKNIAGINLEMALLDLDKNKVVAPFEGLVLESTFSKGEFASPGMTVLSIISKDYIISSNISETDITKLEVGQEVSFTLDAFQTKQYTGKVIKIYQVPENIGEIVTYKINVMPDEANDFKYGFSANLSISSIQAKDVLVVPMVAVYEEDGIQYVDILENGDIIKREVTTGAFSFDYIEIVAGLREGDEVITSRIDDE